MLPLLHQRHCIMCKGAAMGLCLTQAEHGEGSGNSTMSRIRSASSSTSTWSPPASKPGVSSICCSSRPGVATKTFNPAAAVPNSHEPFELLPQT